MTPEEILKRLKQLLKNKLAMEKDIELTNIAIQAAIRLLNIDYEMLERIYKEIYEP